MRIGEKNQIEYDNLLFCFTIVFETVSELFQEAIGSLVGNTGGFAGLFMNILYFLLFLRVVPRLLRTINWKDLIFFLFLALVFLTASLRTEYSTSIAAELILRLFRKGIFFYFGAKLVHGSPKLNRYCRFFACVLLLDVARKMYYYSIDGISGDLHFQYEGYLMLDAMFLMVSPLVMEHKLFDFFLSGLILLLSFSTGARGPLLVTGLLFAAAILLLCRGKRYSNLLYTGLVICAFAIPLSAKLILPALAGIMGSSGSLRSIERLLNGDFLKDDGRITIASTSLDYILDHLLIGSGVGNDRIYIQKVVFWPGVDISGNYAHNFFLEIGMQFGLILGLILCCLLAFLIIRRYNRCALLQEKLLLIGLVFAGFLPLMVSGSYLRWDLFYALVGFAIRSDTSGGSSRNECVS